MSIFVSDIFNLLADWAPMSYALGFDNPGHLVGDMSKEVKKVLVALDATSEVINEAKEESAQLLMKGKVPFEFRTTLVRELHTEEDIRSIGRWLAGDESYFLQSFLDSGDLLSSNLPISSFLQFLLR